jgi:type II restriction enzyme
MPDSYKQTISGLIEKLPVKIDTDIKMTGKPPTLASSAFLTNRRQGDWAEQVILKAINEKLPGYCAVLYGRTEDISSGEESFEEFYNLIKTT